LHVNFVKNITKSFALVVLSTGAAGLIIGGLATSSQAATTCTYAQIIGAGCTLSSGTKTATTGNASNIFVTPFFGRGWQSNDTLTLDQTGDIWSLIFNFTPSGSVRLAVMDASLLFTNIDPAKVLDVVSISRAGTSNIAGLVAGAQATFSDGPTVATPNILDLFGPVPASAPFVDNVSDTTIGLTFVALIGTLNTTTVQITQRDAPVNAVPGPLSILGAASAFGWSRKMRCRIRRGV
jgi:hypothetical protein